MPVIQLPNPLTAASDAVGGYTQQKNENIDRAEHKRQRDATLALERERLASQEKYQSATLDLQGKQFDDNHLMNVSILENQKLDRQIKDAQEVSRKALEPLMRQIQEITLKVAQGQLADEPLKREELRLSIAVKSLTQKTEQLNYDITKKHGAQVAEIALKQAMATLAQTQASTYRTMHPVTYGGGGGVSQEKLKDVRAESEAEFEVNKSVADDQLKAGKTPAEVRTLIEGSASMSNVTKLKLIRYLQTVKPAAVPQEQGPDIGKMFQGAAKAITPFWGGPK